MFDKLKFTVPSEDWISGTPAGNGRIGFMQYGRAGEEIFALNHDALFRKKYKKDIRSAHIIPKMRELIKAGKRAEAEELFRGVAREFEDGCNPFQPFCDLSFKLDGAEFSGYTKELDMADAIVSISYTCDGTAVRYECFADAVSGVIAIKIESDAPVSCGISLCRESDPECQFSARFEDSFGYSYGLFDEGIRFCSASRFVSDGEFCTTDKGARFERFTRLEAYIALDVGEGSEENCRAQLCGLADYESLKAAHIADHRSLYDRVSLSFECKGVDNEKLYTNTLSGDISYEVYGYMFNMARYCMISSSREGSNPINLQGLWCHDLKPDWDCGYTTDINIEMSYWTAEIFNLFECERPLFDWIKNNREIMREQAKNIFGAEDAAYIPQYTDLFMVPATWDYYSPFQVLWSGAAAWISSHFYSYWQYTLDKEFLKNEAYPFLKECMKLYSHLLTDNNGELELVPSGNPENWTIDNGLLVNTCTMDISLIQELIKNLIATKKILGEERDEEQIAWERIAEKLRGYAFDDDGTLLEFTDGNEVLDPNHRHLSHVYGLFPSYLFANDEKLKAAAWKAVERRVAVKGVKHASSWSMSWLACCATAMGDGKRALEFVNHIIKSGLMENYLTVHNDWRRNTGYCFGKKVFQIDAVFGVSRALANMFISSEDGVTHILPALPKDFPSGKLCGVCGVCGFVYDIEWAEGRLRALTVYSRAGHTLDFCAEGKIKNCSCAYSHSDGIVSLGYVEKGEKIEIEFDA